MKIFRDRDKNIIKRLDRKFPEKQISCIDSTPEKMKVVKHVYDGKRCFILGNGPSLKNFDLTRLENEHVFTVNRGGLELLDKPFEHFFGYCIADPEAYRDFGNAIDVDRFDYLFLHSTINCRNYKILEKAIIYDSYATPKLYENCYQFDLTKPLYDSHTVVLHALQIVVYMGFEKIYFLGVDLNFSGKFLHFYSSTEREIKSGESRSQKNQKKMRQGFTTANRILKKRGIYIYNVNPKGNLDCIERADFNGLFNQ